MNVLTAELSNEVQLGIEEQVPLVFVVPEMDSDLSVRLKAAKFIGGIITDDLFESTGPLIEKPIESLYDAIHRAEKEPEARNLIEINVSTEAIEQTIKAGHVGRKVPLNITPEGKITQHNQTYDSVQANSLRIMNGHPVMQPRTEAEVRNGFRIEDVNRRGLFEDYSFVVWSRAENLPGVFFTDTMSCSIQVTAKHDQGLATETAFVAGVKEPGDEPHDEETIIKVFASFGIDVSGMTAAELIDTPLLVHNSLIPNGAIDLVGLYDKCADGTFFGEDKPPQDYLDYLDKCREREVMLQPKIDKIVQELIDEAPTIDSPIKAIKRLHKITEKHMVELAVDDYSINPLVFGPVAAGHIEEARFYQLVGDEDRAEAAIIYAQQTAQATSCPTIFKMGEDPFSPNNLIDTGEDEHGPLTFTCEDGHINTRKHGELKERCATCQKSVKC